MHQIYLCTQTQSTEEMSVLPEEIENEELISSIFNSCVE
jgi:hypothetical protein